MSWPKSSHGSTWVSQAGSRSGLSAAATGEPRSAAAGYDPHEISEIDSHLVTGGPSICNQSITHWIYRVSLPWPCST